MGIGTIHLETFRMIPDRLWSDHRLEHVDIRLWCVLAFVARGRETCEATDITLAEKLAVSERTIRYSLSRLEQCEFIARERVGEARIITLRPQGDGQNTSEFTLKVVGA